MTQIATWEDVNNIAGSVLNSDLLRCPTFKEIKSTNKVDIIGSWEENQLVTKSSLITAVQTYDWLPVILILVDKQFQWRSDVANVTVTHSVDSGASILNDYTIQVYGAGQYNFDHGTNELTEDGYKQVIYPQVPEQLSQSY